MKTSIIQPIVHISTVLALLISLGSPLALASSDSTAVPVSLGVLPGALTMTASDGVTMSSITRSHTQTGFSTGQLTGVTVDDSRGDGSGWSVNATIGNLASYGTFTTDDGSSSPFTVDGVYTGDSDLKLTLTTGSVMNGTSLGHMSYILLDQFGNRYTDGPVQILQAHQAIGTTGLSFDASAIEYRPDTAYHLTIHVLPTHNFTVIPTSPSAMSGTIDGVNAGAECHPQDQDDPCTLSSAMTGFGDGLYRFDTTLDYLVPAGAATGTYSGQIVETIQ